MPDGLWIPVWNGVLDLRGGYVCHYMDGSWIDIFLGAMEDVGETIFFLNTRAVSYSNDLRVEVSYFTG